MTPTKRRPAAVLGGGAWGTTIAQQLATNCETVALWVRNAELRESLQKNRIHSRALAGARLSEKVEIVGDLSQVVAGADLLFVTIPTTSFRSVLVQVGDLVQGDQVLISGSRGLEPDTGCWMSDIILRETCVRKLGALGGPVSSDELGKGGIGAAVIGSRYESVVKQVQSCLSSPRLRIYGNQDLVGVEVGSALTTVMTFLCGIAEGLGFGNSVKAVVLTRGLTEISRLGIAIGASAITFHGLAVLGDLAAAALNGSSEDYRLGRMLASGKSLSESVEQLGATECLPTTRMALEIASHHRIDVPLIRSAAAVLFDQVLPKDIIRALMTRPAIYEG